MNKKEVYWSRLSSDFENRLRNVVGSDDLDIVLSTVNELEINGKLLELGCGNGTFSNILREKTNDYFVTDFSDEMVLFCRDRFKGEQGIRIEKADCMDLQYNDCAFDVVFMANLLHVISDPCRALEESVRVLRPGGRLIVLSFTIEGMTDGDVAAMFERYLKWFGDPPKDSRILTRDGIKTMFRRYGLQVQECKLLGNNTKALFADAVVGYFGEA